jgi:hypothetical protein
MAGADHHATVELTFCERALLVRAGVVEGDPALAGTREAHDRLADRDPAKGPGRGVLCCADLVPGRLAHRGISFSGRGS